MNSSFPNRWSFSYPKYTKYVTIIIAEPKYKYGQQEQVTVRNPALEVVWRSNVHVFIFGVHSNAGKKQAQCHNSNTLWTHILKYDKHMHLKQLSCFCDHYIDLLGVLELVMSAQEGAFTYGHGVT